MTELVDPDQIESIVGARRHVLVHLARAVSAEQTAYILHSHACRARGIDLRSCEYSIALDRTTGWLPIHEDQVLALEVVDGDLVVLTAEDLPHDVELLEEDD